MLDEVPQNGLLQTLVVAVVTSLAGAVSYLYKQVMQLSKSQVKHAREIGELRGRQDGITALSQEVLETVRRALGAGDDNEPPQPER